MSACCTTRTHTKLCRYSAHYAPCLRMRSSYSGRGPSWYHCGAILYLKSVYGVQTTISLHSLLLDRPIFQYNTFYDQMRNQGDLCLKDVTDMHKNSKNFILKLEVKFYIAQVSTELYLVQVQLMHYLMLH